MKWKLTLLEAVEKVIELKKNSDQANLIGHTRLAPLSSGVQRWEQHNEFLTSGVWLAPSQTDSVYHSLINTVTRRSFGLRARAQANIQLRFKKMLKNRETETIPWN